MTLVDLSQFSRKEIEQIKADCDQALVQREKIERKEALKAAEAAANEYGFSLAQLAGGKEIKAPKSKKPAKYANPADRSQTWTGHGRRPEWLKAAMDAGQSLDDFLI